MIWLLLLHYKHTLIQISLSYNTKAIVLSCRPSGEDDCLVTLFTQAYGKIHARAISARKPTSKLRGHIEPGRKIDAMLTSIDRRGRLAQAITLENYHSNDVVRFTATAVLLELAMAMTQPTYDITMWNALTASLKDIRHTREINTLPRCLGLGLMRMLESGGLAMQGASTLAEVHAHIQWHVGKKITSLSKIGALEMNQSIV